MVEHSSPSMVEHSSAKPAVMVADGRCAWPAISTPTEAAVANLGSIGAWPAEATPPEVALVKQISMEDEPLAEVEVETQLFISPLELSWLVHRLQH